MPPKPIDGDVGLALFIIVLWALTIFLIVRNR